MENIKEIWKIIEGSEYYMVSNLGNVRSLDKIIYRKNRGGKPLLKHGVDIKKQMHIDGYYQLRVIIDGVFQTRKVHRLVAMAFIPNPLKLATVNHINGNKLDNRVDNLEWASNLDNLLHAHKTGLMPRKISDKQILEIRSKYIHRVYTMKMLSIEYGVARATIGDIINKDRRKFLRDKRKINLQKANL